MTESTEVAEVEQAAVPALNSTPATELTAEDIALSTIKLGQSVSDLVEDGAVPKGSIFAATGSDDPDPQILWEQGKPDGVVFHVLDLRKGKSVSEDGELTLFAYDDPEAPASAWVTYNYVVALPEVDEDMPYKLLLTKSNKPAAQTINTVLAKNVGTPPHELAFTMDCVQRENAKGKYYVARVRHTEATPEGIELANKLAQIVPAAQAPAPAEAAVEQPAI